jgi:hypothetical protein
LREIYDFQFGKNQLGKRLKIIFQAKDREPGTFKNKENSLWLNVLKGSVV